MIKTYTQHCPVVFGEGSIGVAGEKIKDLGVTKAMIVCDKNGVELGIVGKLEDSLKAAQIDYVVYDGMNGEPKDYMIDDAGAFAKKHKVDGFIGIGGGSCLDASKALDVLYSSDVDNVRPLLTVTKFYPTKYPNVMIPTTFGTGSEVTPFAIVTNTENETKMATNSIPTLAIIDPELSYSIPSRLTAETGMDALAHAVESYTSNNTSGHSEVLALAAAEKIAKHLVAAVKNGHDKEARRQICEASNFAGIAFAETMTHVGHAMAHGMGIVLNLPHGAACALEVPSVMQFVATAVPEKVKVVGELFGVAFAGNETPEQIGSKVGDRLRALNREMGIRSPKELGYTKEQFIACAEYAINDFECGFCPIEVTIDHIKIMLAEIYDLQ